MKRRSMRIHSYIGSIRISQGKPLLIVLVCSLLLLDCKSQKSVIKTSHINDAGIAYRERISINEGWKFMRYNNEPDKLIYDIRPEVRDRNDNVVADSKPTEADTVTASDKGLKKMDTTCGK